MRGKVTNYIWSMAESSGEKGHPPLSEWTHVTQWWQQALFLSFSLAQTHAQHCARLICVPSLSNRMRLFVRTLALPLSFSDFCMPASQPVELLLFVSFDFVPYGHDKEAANSTVRLLCLPFNDFQHYVCMRYTVCDTVCIQSIAVNGILINNWNAKANFLVAFSLSLSLVCWCRCSGSFINKFLPFVCLYIVLDHHRDEKSRFTRVKWHGIWQICESTKTHANSQSNYMEWTVTRPLSISMTFKFASGSESIQPLFLSCSHQPAITIEYQRANIQKYACASPSRSEIRFDHSKYVLFKCVCGDDIHALMYTVRCKSDV